MKIFSISDRVTNCTNSKLLCNCRPLFVCAFSPTRQCLLGTPLCKSLIETQGVEYESIFN